MPDEGGADYAPEPIDTSRVRLDAELLALCERLAKNNHEVWARQRIRDGWRYGRARDDARKEHPSLVPYEELPESEKEYDRNTVLETLKATAALGYRIGREREAGRGEDD
ncbi:MAG: Ryanodine receptor Ryr [Acidobacteria bacterium]|nr:Ryanodine receptor Ryr [Acidobacteriota bacterium]